MNPIIAERLAAVAEQCRAARHGEKSKIHRDACDELGISMATLHRYLHQITLRPARRKRSDAGETALTHEEAHTISSYYMQHIRQNEKRGKSLELTVRELRANGRIVAGTVDPNSGEIIQYLSISAIERALRLYGLHPDQLTQPDPVMPLKSLPNNCWQIDSSLCVLYKLPDESGFGIEEVRSEQRYKNKLNHWAKIEHKLCQRYLVVDHASGAVYIWYALGGERAEHVCRLLAQAVQPRKGYPFYGIPSRLMVDRGSANRSAPFRNLCHHLGIDLIIAQGARAKGSVEKHHDIVEHALESGLTLATGIRTVEQLNELAGQWMHWFNGNARHGRHGRSRYAAWQTIRPDQLITTSLGVEELLALAIHAPQACPVTDYLTVRFEGKHWDCAQVPGVMVGERLSVCRGGFAAGVVQAVLTGEDGRAKYHRLCEKTVNELGFFDDAADLGEEFKRHADTPAQTARKSIERLAMGASTDAEAAARRKAKVAPFAGTIDPYKEMKAYVPPVYFPNRGSEREIAPREVESPRKNHVQMLIWLRDRLGEAWDSSMLDDLRARYPDGATEDELERVLGECRAGSIQTRPLLKVVGR